ncbi:HD family phosphohydrolase [Spirochaetia bacterium]|nr:HD family phosphohydrolase [Spirochaetia bacterium]GHV81806.1 HD family phosphohydrolase [Spirochaetia bacterium]
MKKNDGDIHNDTFLNTLIPGRPRLGPVLVTAAAFLVSLAVIIGGRGYIQFGRDDLREFAVGKVADRDVTAEKRVSYIDEEATRQRLADLEHLVPAVFAYSVQRSEAIRGSYTRFSGLAGRLFTEAQTAEAFTAAVKAEFPGLSAATLNALYRAPNRAAFLESGADILDYFIETGIFDLPSEEVLEPFNPATAELRRNDGPKMEREEIHYDRIITLNRTGEVLDRYLGAHSFPSGFTGIAASLVLPFLTENVFFSSTDSQQRITEIRGRMESVVKYIERGRKVIRKGFVITKEDMLELEALSASTHDRDPRGIIGQVLVMLLLYGLLGFLMGRRTLGRLLKPSEIYLLSCLTVGYMIAAVGCRGLAIAEEFPVAVFLPTALVVMLPALLIGPGTAFGIALALPLGAFFAGALDTASYIFATTSAVAAAYTLRGASRRMDLVKAGLVIGAVNCVAALAVLLMHRDPVKSYPPVLFWAVFNGLASGMLVLGFLPMLEHALNSVTTFRLIELSDLNSPILKRLFTAAPGTYSHSLMVANLAENACQEIGANPLLARVGAYYHDIGKMEQPEYFVENQTIYNKHTEITPRLSATVIRSHVKLGVEKARSLGLPKEVIDIIAEHHGNSVISWFYHEALKKESSDLQSKSAVDMEDFTYPGNPPHSRESAVVMLADVTEAASRTLKKPTTSRLEKFIQELIMSKFEHGQLAESELTFRDLETIKMSFVRVLTGYYHTRIEYPKAAKEGAAREAEAARETHREPRTHTNGSGEETNEGSGNPDGDAE